MTKRLKERINAIQTIARKRDANEIPYFKKIALDKSENPKVRLAAVLAIGGFDWRSVSPLVDISNETEGKVSQTAFRILHALYAKEFKTGWTQEAKTSLIGAIVLFPLMTENRMQ